MSKVTDLKLKIQSGTTSTLYATWEFSKSNVDHYEVTWYYATGDGVWFSGGSSNVTDKVATYSIPSNATGVKVIVKPVSTTYTKNNKETSYWTGTSVSLNYTVSPDNKPEPVSTPEVSISKYKLTAKVVDIKDSKADQVEFYVVKGDTKFNSGIVSVKTERAVFSCTVNSGGYYRVRCRPINLVSNTKVYGDWSSYSNELTTIPPSVTNVKCSALTESSIQVKWDKASTATSYVVEYTTDKTYFTTNPSAVNSSSPTTNSAKIVGLEIGKEYFFRVKAVNDVGESGWSSIASQLIGVKPAAPTAWSSTTTAIVGEEVKLQWVHNSQDNSKQVSAEIQLNVNGKTTVIPFSEETTDDEIYKIYSYTLDLSDYEEGAEILWRIRTKGITNEFSDWSLQSTIDVYAPPTLELHLGRYMNKWLWDTFNFETDSIDTAHIGDVAETFPYEIVATAGPNNQTPVSYSVIITSEDVYNYTNITGEKVAVNAGDEIFSKIVYTSDNPFTIELNPTNITLENNKSYKVTVIVSMNTGLTAEASSIFDTSWTDDMYEPDASIAFDKNTLCAYISPLCVDSNDKLIKDVLLSVYRREYNGRFTELAVDLENDGVITITDPHPSLDYARYRIVAKSKITGSIGYEDLPGEPIGEPSIVIQWDEKWVDFDYNGVDALEAPPWTGSMVRLPYNVDITEEHSPDVSLVEYIGREHPVTYYGTQKGEGGRWSCVVPVKDKETINALRRLREWMGDVYVREPSGTGYWAHITVSMSTTHKELTVPVSFTVKRVEGESR